MNSIAAALILYCAVSAHASHKYGGQLHAVPDLTHYGHLTYPKYDLIDLGSTTHGQLPPTVIQINTHKTIKVPQPYPVKVPVPVPHPIHVPQPYPVVETKIVKVPEPYEVIKHVQVPVEVPKVHEVQQEQASYGYGGHGHGFGDAEGGDEQAGGYEVLAQAQEEGWQAPAAQQEENQEH